MANNERLLDPEARLKRIYRYFEQGITMKDQIAAMVEQSSDLYSKVGNQSIVSYERDGDVSITKFENGLIVYVNYADEAVEYNGVSLEANSFIYR